MTNSLKKITLFFLFIFCVFQNLYALDISISEKAAEAYLYGEYNRGDNYIGSFSILGELGLNGFLTGRAGASFGRAAEAMDLRAFTTAYASFFKNIPLEFSVSWKYSGLFMYETHTNSIIPVIKYGSKKTGAHLGLNFRFTSFFTEAPQFELVPAFLFYFNIINGEILQFGFNLCNFDDFHSKNASAFSLNIYAIVRIDSNWTIINKIEFLQSGIDGLALNFYGFSWKGGVRFSW